MKKYMLSLAVSLLVTLCPIVGEVSATHLRAGEIVVLRESCTSLTFTITINIFTDTQSEVRFGDGVLDFGDGETMITPILENTQRPDLGSQVGFVQYTQRHTYGGPGRYVISYREPNRNEGVLNLFNSVETRFYIETVINIDPFLGCNNTPQLLIPPIDRSCIGATWLHNPGAYDIDGDSVSFELIPPKQNTNYFVNDFKEPNDRKFYESIGLPYATANEQKDGPPTFSINSETGTIRWDAPGEAGEYNIAFLIKEWRRIGDTWVLLGYVTRDMQIIIEECKNERPQLRIPDELCVEAGTEIIRDVFASDPDSDDVSMEAYSVVFALPPSPATFTPVTPVFQSTQGGEAKKTFIWETECEHVKEQPYQVVFKATDRPPRGVSLVDFKTWNITVVGPAPNLTQAAPGAEPRTAALAWDPYICKNAEKIQIWRREGKFDGDPSNCMVGMPDTWNFTMIAEAPASATSFVDDNGGEGLAPALSYCYRIVATFPEPNKGESYVSNGLCLTARADVPIPTHVSVDITGLTDGQITVRWKPPFEADTTLFPPPYTFEVYRSEGAASTTTPTKIHPGRLTDLRFVDSGLNTREKTYNYQITAFDRNGGEVGRSAMASSVRLALNARFEEIELNWQADVPWSNRSQDYPWHLVYRGAADATESQMVLIDSVNISSGAFSYADRGQFNQMPLSSNEQYCYRVMTRGSYDNDSIEAPLENFSQISCAQPDDQEAPCTPAFAVDLTGVPCEEYAAFTPCGPATFSNTLKWPPPSDPVCRQDVAGYNIYVANQRGDAFTLYRQSYQGNEFRDENLPSFARCYKISAVDQAGNESELSEAFCFDNCPNYELPNVFTPNGDPCNAIFSAYGDRVTINEDTGAPCGNTDEQELRRRCARFVERVKFTVFNRWGKPVYTYQSGGSQSIYINWDGRDDNGVPLSEGIYFYSAEVVFDVVDPQKKNRTIKGWVSLIR